MKEYTSATKMIEKNKAVWGFLDDRSPGVKEYRCLLTMNL